MKLKTLFILLILNCQFSIVNSFAQPKWIKKAKKALVTLSAVQQEGDTLTAAAFYVDAQGGVVAPLSLLKKACQAWVEDERGRREVTHIAGFDATYDVCRLLTVGKGKVTPLALSSQPLIQGQHIWLMPKGMEDEVVQIENAGQYNYYTLKQPLSLELVGQPLLTDDGLLAGIVQCPLRTKNAPNYALDIRLPMALGMSVMDANAAPLRECFIPKVLPQGEEQARTFLYLAAGTPALRESYARTFVESYPKSNAGYVQLAQIQLERQQYAQAFDTYAQALELPVQGTDEVLYNRALAQYNVLSQGDSVPAQWTLEQALADVQQAFSQNPLPLYTLLEARVLFAQKQYARANECFLGLTHTNLRTPDLFLYAAQCQEKMGISADSILCMNDSAVAQFSRPYTREAANYLWLRALRRQEAGKLRLAIQDMNDYEHIFAGNLNHEFYYQREQMELRSRMLPQALADIDRAIRLNPTEALYHAERGVVLYRGGEREEATRACRRALELEPDFVDAHRILGICLREMGQKEEAKQHLQQAASLGDALAQEALKGME